MTDPIGREIEIPACAFDDADPSFGLEQLGSIRAHYDREGYAVVRAVIPPSLCEVVRAAFLREVKPYAGFLYRQATAKPERHVFTQHGYMLNALLNIQDLQQDVFARFRENSLAVLAHRNIQTLLAALLGEGGVLVQSMFFEGNPETWAHQDTYYLDSAKLGGMAAVWVAMEDISPGAGRFYVYPGSHTLDLPRNSRLFGIAFHHESYKNSVIELIKSRRLVCRAPAMAKGDVLVWNSKTIHGSLRTTQPERSRCSLTAHYIPQSTQLLQFQARKRSMKLSEVNSLRIHCPKDQNKVLNRLVLHVERSFPTGFQFLKRLMIRIAAIQRFSAE
ncbi:MAG: phytanoyl-CoA dioxygenase family protein [Nitrospiraceae bacterium]|nr:phytanoyl-CoA dioxygenase family protein [Nitrospiraceae bacterium]